MLLRLSSPSLLDQDLPRRRVVSWGSTLPWNRGSLYCRIYCEIEMNRAEPDYYEILQVSPRAEQTVIEAAYRRLAQRYHPDVNKDPDAPERMRLINQAFEVLGNPGKRGQYDARRRLPRTEEEQSQDSHVETIQPSFSYLGCLFWLIVPLGAGLFVASRFGILYGIAAFLIAISIGCWNRALRYSLRGFLLESMWLIGVLYIAGAVVGTLIKPITLPLWVIAGLLGFLAYKYCQSKDGTQPPGHGDVNGNS